MSDREVDFHGNCSKCGGTHYGSFMCPFTECTTGPSNDEPAPELTDAGGAPASQPAEYYLGDGRYSRVDAMGAIWLRAPREDGDHVVCLEPDVLAEFERWVKHLRKAAKQGDPR